MIELTAQIVSAFISNNQISTDEIPNLVKVVHKALNEADGSPDDVPAVSIEDSIKSDSLVCLEDGVEVVMLRRYLKTHHNMTPEEYLEKWNLPQDYPLVAPSYSERRRQIAVENELGKGPKT